MESEVSHVFSWWWYTNFGHLIIWVTKIKYSTKWNKGFKNVILLFEFKPCNPSIIQRLSRIRLKHRKDSTPPVPHPFFGGMYQFSQVNDTRSHPKHDLTFHSLNFSFPLWPKHCLVCIHWSNCKLKDKPVYI